MGKSIRSKIKKKHRSDYRQRITKPYLLVRERQIQNKLKRSIAGQSHGSVQLRGDGDEMDDEEDGDEDDEDDEEEEDEAKVVADMKPRFSFAKEMGVEGPTVVDNRVNLRLHHVGNSSEGRVVMHGLQPLAKLSTEKPKAEGEMEVETKKLENDKYEWVSRPSTGSTTIRTTKTKNKNKFVIFHPQKRKGQHSTTNRNKR